MHVERVYTNETCNQACRFCDKRRPDERREIVDARRVRARIVEALERATEIVFTGGEPTLRRDLAELVAHAKREGASRVVLETNAALVDDAHAAALRDAGLDVARIHLPAWGGALDAITRDPGGFASTRRGMQAFARAGVALEVATPIVRDNAALAPALPDALAAEDFPVARLVLGVPVDAPDLTSLLSLPEAARAIETTVAAATRVGLDVAISPDASIPPCLFESPGRMAHLYTLTPGGATRSGYARVAACASCAVRDRCPGFDARAVARPESGISDETITPIRDDRTRRRLSLISTVDEQIARELAQDDIARLLDGVLVSSRIIRINFRCNQACEFCFVSTHLPNAEEAAVRAEIVAASKAGQVVILSGGEPTLNANLVEYVALARDTGARFIEIQTNAIRLDDGALVAALVEAGLGRVFISLHGSHAAISDAVTRAPGTFEKTVRGIDRVIEAGVRTHLNFVFCQENRADFPDFVDLVGRRWPTADLIVSFVAASTDVVPRTPELVPRYSDVMPALSDGLARARAHGLAVSGFDSMCGMPLCLVPDDLAQYFALAELPDGFDRGELQKTDECARCALSSRCFGIRRGYAALHGTGELRAVASDSP